MQSQANEWRKKLTERVNETAAKYRISNEIVRFEDHEHVKYKARRPGQTQLFEYSL